MDGTVLVADDDRTIRTVLTQALTRAGCKVHATSSLTTLMRWVGEGKGDVVISDVMMPDGNGLEMLPKIAQDRPGLPVIVISAQNTIMTAIKAAEAEAYDYLPKPFDLPELMKRTAKALSEKRTAQVASRIEVTERPDELPLVGRTEVMQALYRLIARVMNTDMPLLITGESGTGKSLIGRAIHDFSDRRTLPYVQASVESLIELEGPARLLREVKGGTLLIDEIVDLPDEAQTRLVRMMDTPGDHAPRFIATTTQQNLADGIKAGTLRQDLYYRICGTELHVPALRERVEDIALLCEHFLARAESEGAPHRAFSEEARELMRHFAWPGNIRQLENITKRLSLTAPSEEIGKAEVAAALGPQSTGVEPVMGAGVSNEKLSDTVARHLQRYFDLHGDMLPPPGLYARLVKEVETPLIEIALSATGGNQAKCADLLGINRNTLRKKITDLDIEVTRRRKLM